MVKIVMAAAVFIAALGPAQCQTSRDQTPARSVPPPADVAPPPLNPLEVPTWMRQTIEHILSDDGPQPKTAPTRQ